MNVHQRNAHKNITIQNSPRPPRIVFLVEENEHSSKILDDIFSYSYSIWGGLRTIIIPVIDGDISKEYIEWIQLFDPDIVYSYARLSTKIKTALEKATTAITFKEHPFHWPNPTNDKFTPVMDFQFIQSVSLVPHIMSKPLFSGLNQSLCFIFDDSFNEGTYSKLLLDNFGFCCSHYLTLIKAQFPNLVLLGVADDQHSSRLKGANYFEAKEFLSNLFQNIGWTVFSPAFLSGYDKKHLHGQDSHLYCAYLNYAEHEVEEADFNLFIGDSFEDRVHFWNSRHNFNGWHDDPSTVSLRIPENCLNDASFIGTLSKYLLNRIINGRRRSRRIQIFSCAITNDVLENFIQQLGLKNFISIKSFKRILPLLPSDNPYNSMRQLVTASEEIQGTQKKVTPCLPWHLDDVKNLDFLRNENWFVEFEIERHNNLYPCYDEDGDILPQFWRLPRNNCAAQVFIKDRSYSRIQRDKKLCVIASNDDSAATKVGSIPLKLPSDEKVFQKIFEKLPTVFKNNDLRNTYTEGHWSIQLSDKGEAFKIVVDIFGGLYIAYQYLDDPFWRELLCHLSGINITNPSINLSQILLPSQPLTDGKFKEIVNKSKDGFLKNRLYFTDREHFSDKDRVSKKKARNSSNDFLKQQAYFGDRNREFQYLIELKILERLENGEIIISTPAKRDLPKCLHEVWILGRLLHISPQTFFYYPQTEILYDYTNVNLKNEIDFVCVSGGLLIIGESKRSSSGFTEDIIKNLLNIAQYIHADIVLLAYEVDDIDIKSKIARMDALALGIDIRFIHIFSPLNQLQVNIHRN